MSMPCGYAHSRFLIRVYAFVSHAYRVCLNHRIRTNSYRRRILYTNEYHHKMAYFLSYHNGTRYIRS